MASNTPGAPVFTGIKPLTKEEKEVLLEKKMEEIQRKNAALKKRHQEIEADRKAAEMSGMAVNPKLQTSTAPLSPKKDMKGVGEDGRTEDRRSAWAAGRGKRLKSNQEKQNKDESKEAKPPGKDGKLSPNSKNIHPLVRDVGQMEEGRPPSGLNRPARRGARGGKPPIPARTSNSPPPDPGYSFLCDRGRQGPVPKDRPRRGRGGEAFRHPRNFGGTDFGDVKSKMRAAKERDQGRHISGAPPRPDLELTLTGRERREYLQWKEDRERIDQARIDRQKAASGQWKREWDADKDENFEPPPPCPPSPKHMAPHRRLGRIGSGRFQHAQLAAADRAVVSLPGALRQGGRGTGRGRGYRDKASSPAPGRLRLRKTSTSSDDRSVDSQNNSLVIKIDNEYAKAAEAMQEKRVHFRMPNGNRGRGDASQGRGRRGEQPNNRGGGRRAGVGSGRLRPGSSWQPQDQEEYWEDEGAIMPLVSDTQPPINKLKVTKANPKPKATTKVPVDASAALAAVAAAATNGAAEEKKVEEKEETPKIEKKEELNNSEEMIHVNEEDLDDDDDDQWLDIDDPHDFYDMRHGNLGEFSDEEDAHNSSAESLERFIQEHTLVIDKTTGLPAQTPPESQNSQTSQTSQGSGKAYHSLNDSKGSGSDRASPAKTGNLSDSDYEAAPSPIENIESGEINESVVIGDVKESVNDDTTGIDETVDNKNVPETVENKNKPQVTAESESETVENKAEPETVEEKPDLELNESQSEQPNTDDSDTKSSPTSAVADNAVQPQAESAVSSEPSKIDEVLSESKETKSENEETQQEAENKPSQHNESEEAKHNESEDCEEAKQDAKESASQDLDSSCGSRSEEDKFEDAREGAASSASSEATQSGTPEHKPKDNSKQEETIDSEKKESTESS